MVKNVKIVNFVNIGINGNKGAIVSSQHCFHVQYCQYGHKGYNGKHGLHGQHGQNSPYNQNFQFDKLNNFHMAELTYCQPQPKPNLSFISILSNNPPTPTHTRRKSLN